MAIPFASCTHYPGTGSLRGPARIFGFNRIEEGTDEAEILRLLGSPDEIRILKGDELLEGTIIGDARNPTNHETHRWAYGPRQPGTFAREGIISFDASNKVIWAESPVWRAGGVFNEVAAKPVAEGSSFWPEKLSCQIDEVTMVEAHGKMERGWFAKVTIRNDGEQSFSTDCYVDSINRLVVIEVCDQRNTPIFRVDRNHLNNGFMSRSNIFTVPAGGARTEEVYFDPDDYFGPLVPGRYLVRAFFRWRAGYFISSARVEFKVTPFSNEKH